MYTLMWMVIWIHTMSHQSMRQEVLSWACPAADLGAVTSSSDKRHKITTCIFSTNWRHLKNSMDYICPYRSVIWHSIMFLRGQELDPRLQRLHPMLLRRGCTVLCAEFPRKKFNLGANQSQWRPRRRPQTSPFRPHFRIGQKLSTLVNTECSRCRRTGCGLMVVVYDRKMYISFIPF